MRNKAFHLNLHFETLVWCLVFAAWFAHLIVSFNAKAWLFLWLGTLIWPVALIHGISTLLGMPWVG